MKEQSFKNHAQYVVGYHVITSLLLLGSIIFSIIYSVKYGTEQLVLALSVLFTVASLAGVFWYARSFALRAQDRAIRSEENLRYFSMTGKLLPSELRMSQIIALRFASNEEFVKLVEKAASQKLSSKEIKASIQTWRPDYNRA